MSKQIFTKCKIMAAQQQSTLSGKEYFEIKIMYPYNSRNEIISQIWFRKPLDPLNPENYECLDKKIYLKFCILSHLKYPKLGTLKDGSTSFWKLRQLSVEEMNATYPEIVKRINLMAAVNNGIDVFLPIRKQHDFKHPNIEVEDVSWYQWVEENNHFINFLEPELKEINQIWTKINANKGGKNIG